MRETRSDSEGDTARGQKKNVGEGTMPHVIVKLWPGKPRAPARGNMQKPKSPKAQKTTMSASEEKSSASGYSGFCRV